MFAIILAVAGVWFSKNRPWKGGNDRTAVAKAFLIMSVPFVIAETATGVVSFLTGELRIPPTIGVGTVMDVTILVVGMVVLMARAFMMVRDREKTPQTGVEE